MTHARRGQGEPVGPSAAVAKGSARRWLGGHSWELSLAAKADVGLLKLESTDQRGNPKTGQPAKQPMGLQAARLGLDSLLSRLAAPTRLYAGMPSPTAVQVSMLRLSILRLSTLRLRLQFHT